MAERSNATSKKTQDGVLDVSTLQKRGRRRLVGAIALVLLAVIVLPMVFDPEPKPNAPLVNIRIPGEDAGKFTPKGGATGVAPAAESVPKAADAPTAVTSPTPPVASSAVPVQALEPVSPAAKALEDPKPAKLVEKPPEKPPAKVAEKVAKLAEKPAPHAAGAEQIIFQVGAFASADKVKAIVDQLKEAKLPHFTESVATSGGPVTRVRLGPFASKVVADRALGRAKALGLNPVNVAPK